VVLGLVVVGLIWLAIRKVRQRSGRSGQKVGVGAHRR
jgi:hypothetical protein